jgi:hypothetical protein
VSEFGFQIDPERAVKLTRFAAITVGLVFSLAATAFIAIAVFHQLGASKAESSAREFELRAAAVREILAEARSKDEVAIRTQTKAVADFQESVSRLAGEHACTLSEFISSTDFQPFLSRFTKSNDSSGWSQVDAQITLVGPSRNVTEVIRRLSEQTVPIEFSSVQVSRERILDEGSEVKAKIQVRILVKTPGGVA